MQTDLNERLGTAIELAREAGQLILRFYAADFVVEEKIGVDNFSELVTEADRAASELIVAGLRRAFPDDGILSEELADTDERLGKQRVWIIDPIDGTNGFVHRTGDFAVQIGLALNGASVLGVVYEPLGDKLYRAVRDAGTWLETAEAEPRRLRVSETTDFHRMTLAVSRSHRSPKMNRVVQTFGFRHEIQRGSVGVKVGLLAERECDVYIHLSPRTKQWDTCAPDIILAEAGGAMTDLFGEPIIYNTPNVQNYNGVVSSNGVAQAAVIKHLKPLLTEFGRYRIKGGKLKPSG